MIGESRALTAGGLPNPFPPMGMDAIRSGIELAIQLAWEQRIIPRKLHVDELFDSDMQKLV